ncbi:MAG: Gfo/Idh/MocA family oxidoreductase [Actinomycetota bacterium]
MSNDRLKIGLVGTGYWADQCHAAGIDRNDDLEFVGVWGRDAGKAADLATRHDTRAFDTADALFAAADVITYAVPPAAQAALAPRPRPQAATCCSRSRPRPVPQRRIASPTPARQMEFSRRSTSRCSGEDRPVRGWMTWSRPETGMAATPPSSATSA